MRPYGSIKVQCRISQKNFRYHIFRNTSQWGIQVKLAKFDKKFSKKDKSYQLNKSVLSIDVFRSGKPFGCIDAIAVR